MRQGKIPRGCVNHGGVNDVHGGFSVADRALPPATENLP